MSDKVREKDAIAAKEILSFALFKEILHERKKKKRKVQKGENADAEESSSDDDDDEIRHGDDSDVEMASSQVTGTSPSR